jgi:hypothetical protein
MLIMVKTLTLSFDGISFFDNVSRILPLRIVMSMCILSTHDMNPNDLFPQGTQDYLYLCWHVDVHTSQHLSPSC